METSYKKLWKRLIDLNMTKTDLRLRSGISTMTLAKLGKGENVSLEVLKKICATLGCDIGDIMEMISIEISDESLNA
jgi:DNA-binding Xre family transcriptional regulator